MKTRLGLIYVLAGAVASAAVTIGDTYEKVVAEKGPPNGKIEAGGLVVLNYPDQKLKLKDGKVVSIDAPPPRPNVVAQPSPVPKSQARPINPDTASSARAPWTNNFQEAAAVAGQQNRQMLLFFNSSDTCDQCAKLRKEVFSTPEFNQYANETLVLVEADFPQQTPQAPELMDQNRQLAQLFQVTTFPTVLVFDASGKILAKLGYAEGNASTFMDLLRSVSGRHGYRPPPTTRR